MARPASAKAAKSGTASGMNASIARLAAKGETTSQSTPAVVVEGRAHGLSRDRFLAEANMSFRIPRELDDRSVQA
jgi:hypothetical protein